MCCLLSVVAFTAFLAVDGPRSTAILATSTSTSRYTDRLGVCAVDRDEVTSQVVLATEGSATRLMLASVWLGAVRVVGLDMRFEIERTSKGWGAEGQLR